MNDENLIKAKDLTSSELRERAQKGGQASARSRRQKSDMRKAAQTIIDGLYTDKEGQTKSGAEMLVLTLFGMATDVENKQAISAIKLLMELTGQDKSLQDKKRAKAELELLQAKTKLLTGGDDDKLKKLDEILEGLETNAKNTTEPETE